MALISTKLVAQTSDMELLKKHCEKSQLTELRKSDHVHKELSLPSKIAFSFYRSVLSEQISADCAFDLTCSRFSAAAIRRFGIIKGGFLTVDRLTRCHSSLSVETVPINFNNRTAKVIDDPSMY
jgi:putative component of membrane protein insertase Oxa1/YidC/SpoIIIJ protein YidD